MIFDTTFVIDLMRNNKEAVSRLHQIINGGETQLITALTIFELFSGLAQSNKPIEEKIRSCTY